MHNLIGLAFAASIATSGLAAAQAAGAWTGGFGGLQWNAFSCDSEGGNGVLAEEFESRVGNINGVPGYDWRLYNSFLFGGEAGVVLHSGKAENKGNSDVKCKIGSGYYLRPRAGYVVDGALLCGLPGYGSCEGGHSVDNERSEFLLPDGRAVEYGIGVEQSLMDWSLRAEYVILDFSSPDDVADFESSSSKFGVGGVYRF